MEFIIRIMENKMETLGPFKGIYRDYIGGCILGLYRDNGKEHGNYFIVIGYILGLYRDNGKKWKLLY